MIISLDTETTGLDSFHGCRPFLVTACNGKSNFYWWGTVNVYTREVTWERDDIDEIQELIDNADRIITQNGNFDIRMLADIGVKVPHSKLEDIMVAAHCVSSWKVKHRSLHSLDTLALRYLDVHYDEEAALHAAAHTARKRAKLEGWAIAAEGHPHFPAQRKQGSEFFKQDYWLVPERCLVYGLKDVEVTLRLWAPLRAEIIKYDLWDAYRKRMELLEIAYEIQTYGRYVNVEAVNDLLTGLERDIKHHTKKIRDLSGITYRFNHEKKAHLVDLLHTRCKIPVHFRTKSGQASVTKDALKFYIKDYDHPVLTELESIKKKYKKQRDLITLKKWLKDGRTHSSLNITGTRETRQSSSLPNDQNWDKSVNYLLCAEPGHVIIATDLVNIELRIWAYATGNRELIDAFEQGRSVHLMIMKVIFPEEHDIYVRIKDRPFEELSENMQEIVKCYTRVKNGNFSRIYGATDKKTNETYHGGKNAPNYCAKIDARFPEIKTFFKSTERMCFETLRKENVFAIHTIGAKYPLKNYPSIGTGGYRLDVPIDKPYVAANYYIQGTAGWIMGDAMIAWYKHPMYRAYDCHMNSQVHDGLDTEVKLVPELRDIITTKLRVIEAAGKQYIPTCKVSYKLKYHPNDETNTIIQDLLQNPVKI